MTTTDVDTCGINSSPDVTKLKMEYRLNEERRIESIPGFDRSHLVPRVYILFLFPFAGKYIQTIRCYLVYVFVTGVQFQHSMLTSIPTTLRSN